MLRKNSKLKTIESPINRGFSYEKKRKNLERKIILTLCQNRESSLNPKEHLTPSKSRLISTSSNQSRDFPSIKFEIKPTALNFKSKLKYIQSHIQLGDIRIRFKIKLRSHFDCKVTWRSN